ncbi:MAG: ubiquinone biosynthesis protein UbiB [Gammaproteobacteria bacterium]|nr:ubiquinone biosynthesis protein UbiB [Gammaproteobacteria bacterium]HEV7442195.1 ubiquinone biosynthesis regulatory protein kinase UbiB [Steroidobacteraceae bacterium]
MKLRVLARLIQIQRVLLKHGLDDFVRATHLYRPLRFAFFLSPGVWFERSRLANRGERLRLALQELGPIFVKFGQAVSTRRDLLPADIANELAKLQDRVPPFPGHIAREIIELAHGRPVTETFAAFDETPLAAASIAQVHAANLRDGTEVVVKVLRPGMTEVIKRDLEVLYALADLAQRYWTESRRLRPLEIVAEYEKTILDELDLMREAANASQLKRNFLGSDLLYVPEIHWDYCRINVMVMERIYGVPISDMERLRAVGTDIAQLAENGVRIFFTQVFRHNFFHADMHPGNIFVLLDDPRNPRYAAVDFGIVGTLDPRDQNYLAENFLAVFDRDYRRVALLHVESGWVPPGTRVDEMESAIRTVCEPIFDRPLEDISFGQILVRLFEISRRFDMQVQPQLILLQKTLLNVEGLGRDLYPQLDIWKTASPILREWMRERVGVRQVFRSLRTQMPELLETARALPSLLKAAVHRSQGGLFHMQVESAAIEEIRTELRKASRRRDAVTVGAAILLGGLVWLGVNGGGAWAGWVLTVAGMGWVVVAARRA